MFVYSIFDKKGNFHMSQFFARNDAEATRAISMEANNSKSNLCNFPHDFALYCVGKFDSDNGTVSPFMPIVHVVDVASLIRREEKEQN